MTYKVILVFLVISSCTRQSEETKIKEILLEYNKPVNLEIEPVIIIPLYGCESCVEKALNFMKSENNTDKYCFILSSMYKKEFIIKAELIQRSTNIVFDSLNLAGSNRLVINSPVFYYKNDSLISIVLQTDQDYLMMINMLDNIRSIY